MTRTLPLLLLVAACGEPKARLSLPMDSDLEVTQPLDDEPFEAPACAAEQEPECVSDGSRLCPGASGYAFLRAQTFLPDELTTATLSAPEPGTICMSGRLATIADDGGGAALSLYLDERGRDNTCIRSVFDARALGISALELTLDQVPNTRLTISAVEIQKAECDLPVDCIDGGFYDLFTPTRDDFVLLVPGMNRAPLEDFIAVDSGEPLDGRRLSFFTLYLQPTNKPIDFNFCVSQLRFSDAANRTIVPPAR